ncbi:MAG: hypothetical protein NVS2B17_29130 [Candidatus Velthaea sp.]
MRVELDASFAKFAAKIGAPRGDEGVLHGSDLSACDYATWLRINGEYQLPFDDGSRERFLMGHAVEAYIAGAFDGLRERGFVVTHGREIDHLGIVGHLDFDISQDGRILAVVDVTTTAGKSCEPQDSHKLKTAFYAHALGAPEFCEWVFQLGWGKIVAQQAHWFATAAHVGAVESALERLSHVKVGSEAPAMEPPRGQEWRCKQYCQAYCPRNGKLARSGAA